MLNVAYDRMDSPAPYFSDLYAQFGKSGVTLTLVCAGLTIILLGIVMANRPARKPKEEDDVVERLFAFGGVGGTTASGHVELQTRKYLTPPRGNRTHEPTPAPMPAPLAQVVFSEPAPVAEVVNEPPTGLTAEAEPLPDDVPFHSE